MLSTELKLHWKAEALSLVPDKVREKSEKKYLRAMTKVLRMTSGHFASFGDQEILAPENHEKLETYLSNLNGDFTHSVAILLLKAKPTATQTQQYPSAPVPK